jgi:protease I
MTSMNGRLRGKRVGVVVADGFEWIELSVPMKALKRAGATVEVISLHGGKVRGVNLTAPTRTVRVGKTIEEANPQDYDALLIPGGFVNPDFLRQSSEVRDFVRAFDRASKPIATLCHGPWLLASANLVEGRTLAAWPGIRDDMVNAGATWLDQPLVLDRNWVTSRGPQDLGEFVPAMIEAFAAGGTDAQDTASGRSSSPQATKPPHIAVKAARLLPGPTMRTVAAAAAIVALGAYVWRRAA